MLASVLVVVFLFLRSRRVIPLKRVSYYSLLTILLGIAIAIGFTIRNLFLGGVEVSGWILYTSLFVAATVQLWRLESRPGYVTLAKSYAIGTFAIILSDLFRILSGVINASPEIIGAAGVMDAVFLAGPYLVLFYMIATLLFVIRLEIGERWSRAETI